MTVGQFLVNLRHEAGLTQKAAADQLGISNKTISRWETDRGLPDVDLLGRVAGLYGVTVDELLAGQRFHQNENLSKEEKIRSTLSLAENNFRHDCMLLRLFTFLGLFVFLLLFFKVNAYTMSLPNYLDLFIHGLYLFLWLSGILLTGILIFRKLYQTLNNVNSNNEEEKQKKNQILYQSTKKLCATLIILLIGFLPLLLGQEYLTYDRLERNFRKTYEEYGETPDDKTVEEFLDTCQKIYSNTSVQDAIQQKHRPIRYFLTYLQYLPMSACIGLAVWKVITWLLYWQSTKRKMVSDHIKKPPREIHDAYLLVGIVILFLLTYHIGPLYATDRYQSQVVYEDQESFDTFINNYLNAYEGLRKYGNILGKTMPELSYGVTKIDQAYMDSVMPETENYAPYRDVTGFNYKTWTVYKTGYTADWMDLMGRWNDVIFLSGSELLFTYLPAAYVRKREKRAPA